MVPDLTLLLLFLVAKVCNGKTFLILYTSHSKVKQVLSDEKETRIKELEEDLKKEIEGFETKKLFNLETKEDFFIKTPSLRSALLIFTSHLPLHMKAIFINVITKHTGFYNIHYSTPLSHGKDNKEYLFKIPFEGRGTVKIKGKGFFRDVMVYFIYFT